MNVLCGIAFQKHSIPPREIGRLQFWPPLQRLGRLGCEELAPPARCDGIFHDLA